MEQYDFFKQFNAFGAWLKLKRQSLTPSSILLWYALLQISNLSGRKTELHIPNKLLMEQTGLAIPAIHRARKHLKENGLIDFYKNRGRKATTYIINPLYQDTQFAERNVKQDTQFAERNVKQDTQFAERNVKQTPSFAERNVNIIRGITTEDKYTEKRALLGNATKETVKIFESKIHPLSSISEKENLLDLIEEFGTSQVTEAINEAARCNGRSLKYISAVLSAWKNGGKNGNQRKGTSVPKGQLPEDMDALAQRKWRHFVDDVLPTIERKKSGGGSEGEASSM